MTIHRGRSPNDRTLRQAEDDARRDYDRIAHGHSVTWTVQVFEGRIFFWCSCPSSGPRSGAELEKHIEFEVRKERIPKPAKR